MSPKEDKELKEAVEGMDQVVESLKFHTKLKLAWKKLRGAIDRANRPDVPKQEDMFPND